MEKNAFIHYKKTVSWVLCISYVVQLFFWIAIHHCIPQTSDINWVFNVGFWGLNFLLIFAIAFFHLHKNNPRYVFGGFMLFTALSTCSFCLSCYDIIWANILTLFIVLITFLFRKKWVNNCEHYYKNMKYLCEESPIRITLYLLPPIFLTVIGVHIENILPNSKFSLIVVLVYLTFAYAIITTTYFAWYLNIMNKVSARILFVDIVWLFVCFSSYIAILNCSDSFLLAIIPPMLGITPILDRHKRT